MSKEIEYINDFHRENSLALQESVRLVSKQRPTLTDFMEQIKKLNKGRKVKRER